MLRYEAKPRYQFAAVQSIAGAELLRQYQLNPENAESFLLIRNNKALTHSSAALELCRDLPRWRWLRLFLIVPRPIRDAAYTLLARNRYRLFGQKQQCELQPTQASAANQARFLQ